MYFCLSGGLDMLSYFTDIRFIIIVFIGSLTGLLVGSIPGLSVTMATAILLSITYTWSSPDAFAMIMGVYVVGVFSGAISAILINIPGAPSSVVTTLDGYPLAKKGKANTAIKYTTVYSFIGSVFGFIALFLLAKPISLIALKFTPMDYFLLAAFGLSTVGSLTSKSYVKGLISASLGLLISMIGMDSLMGTPRLDLGIYELRAGVSIVPVLIGLFGLAEVFMIIYKGVDGAKSLEVEKSSPKLGEILKHFFPSLYYSTIGLLVGALPGAGAPVASFIAYSRAKKRVKNPEVAFGKGAVEGIVASESANNAVIGGALIPMLVLGIPGDAVTAIILSVFSVHGLQAGPLFIRTSEDMFSAILAGGFLASLFLLFLGLFIAPHISKILLIPKKFLLPIVSLLCVVGAFAYNNRSFDIALMLVFALIGFLMRLNKYPVAPMTLAIVLGKMMDDNFRRAISLASSESNRLMALFGRPITLLLLLLILFSFVMNIPALKRRFGE